MSASIGTFVNKSKYKEQFTSVDDFLGNFLLFPEEGKKRIISSRRMLKKVVEITLLYKFTSCC